MEYLKKDAWCPVCGKDVAMLFRTEGPTMITLTFTHEDQTPEHNLTGSIEDMNTVRGRIIRDMTCPNCESPGPFSFIEGVVHCPACLHDFPSPS